MAEATLPLIALLGQTDFAEHFEFRLTGNAHFSQVKTHQALNMFEERGAILKPVERLFAQVFVEKSSPGSAVPMTLLIPGRVHLSSSQGVDVAEVP